MAIQYFVIASEQMGAWQSPLGGNNQIPTSDQAPPRNDTTLNYFIPNKKELQILQLFLFHIHSLQRQHILR